MWNNWEGSHATISDTELNHYLELEMKNQLKYFLIAVFSIFVGSQITEGVLLVPYWQSLSASEFYSYYLQFGPAINRFYTVLTILALLIPIGVSLYYYRTQSAGLTFSLIATLLALLFVSCFYIYFKGTNQAFYQSAFSEVDLKSELVVWTYWHWGRVVLEVLSLYFLVKALANNEAVPR